MKKIKSLSKGILVLAITVSGITISGETLLAQSIAEPMRVAETTQLAAVQNNEGIESIIANKCYLNYTSVTLRSGATLQLKLNGGEIKSCTSSNKSIAKVSSKGKIYALSRGSAVISVTGVNGKKYKCNVIVK